MVQTSFTRHSSESDLMTRQNFKVMPYQTDAVNAVVDCFEGQPHQTGFEYRVDPGRNAEAQVEADFTTGFRNPALKLSNEVILANVQRQQRSQNLGQSEKLISNIVCPINLDVEMETGTGKTYCYIKTMFEMNKRVGWAKFIIVVPSIAAPTKRSTRNGLAARSRLPPSR